MDQQAVALLLIAGIVELITRLRAADYWTVATIGSAGVVGFLLGIAHFYVPDPIAGIAFGISASGLVTIVGSIRSRAISRPATIAPIQSQVPPTS